MSHFVNVHIQNVGWPGILQHGQGCIWWLIWLLGWISSFALEQYGIQQHRQRNLQWYQSPCWCSFQILLRELDCPLQNERCLHYRSQKLDFRIHPPFWTDLCLELLEYLERKRWIPTHLLEWQQLEEQQHHQWMDPRIYVHQPNQDLNHRILTKARI